MNEKNDLETILNSVASCKGLGCPISDDCLHHYSKKQTDILLSPFNHIEAYCSEFVSYKCTQHLMQLEKHFNKEKAKQ